MGNKRNERNRHICEGKLKKKKPPIRWGTEQDTLTSTTTPMSFNSCRIINLEELRKHIADISVHAATCQSWIDKAYMQGEAIMRDGLASVLTAQCKGCGTEIAFPTSPKVNCKGAQQHWECNLAAVVGANGNWWGVQSPSRKHVHSWCTCYDHEIFHSNRAGSWKVVVEV